MFHRVLSVCFFFLLGFNVYGQGYSLDSIQKVLQTSMHDTTRLATITQILENENQRDSISIYYNKEVIAIITKNLKSNELDFDLRNKYLYYLAYWYADRAVVLESLQPSLDVIDYIDSSIAIFNYLHMTEAVWISINNKGNLYRSMGDPEKAIIYFFEALKNHELTNNQLGVANTKASIGAVYLDQNRYKDAITYYQEALAYYNTLENPKIIDFYDQAIINHNIGVCYFYLNNYDYSKKYYAYSLAINEEQGFYNNISFNYERLADISIKENKLEEAEKLYQLGMKHAIKDRSKAMLLNGLGELYLIKKEYSKAINNFLKALEHNEQAKDIEIATSIYENLYIAYKETKQFDQSLKMFELYTEVKKSVNEESAKNELAKQKLKYDFEKKEFQTKLAHERQVSSIKLDNQKKNIRKNIILYSLLFLGIILIISILYLYKYYKQKNIINTIKNNELKQKLLISQMNPHFIFNSIDNIQSLIHHHQNDKAINYLSKFSKLTRQILENSRESYISLEEELDMIENYLTIQCLLYNNSFKFHIHVDPEIDIASLLLPPMLTQPFIENAIKHGVKNKIDGLISIYFKLNETRLLFIVEDNGNGFDSKSTSEHKSLSIQITNERLANYSKKAHWTISKENTLNSHGDIIGAKIFFEIPYIYEN